MLDGCCKKMHDGKRIDGRRSHGQIPLEAEDRNGAKKTMKQGNII